MNNQTQLVGYLGEPWFWQVITVIFIIVAVNIGAYYLLRQIEKIAARTQSIWDDAFIKAARLPVTMLLWTLGAAIALRIVHQHSGIPYFDWVATSRNVLVISALAWLLIRLIDNAAANLVTLRLANEETVDRTTVDALSKLGRICVVVVASLSIL